MAYEKDPESIGAPVEGGPGRGVQHVEVTVDDAGTRLDNFLVRQLKDVPRTHVFRLLRKGEVRVNKKRARPDQRVTLGDIVRIPPVRRAEEVPPPAAPRVASPSLQKLVLDAIVYEDPDLIVFNKPPGVAVHGGSATDFGLIEAFRAARPDVRDAELVHRLDRETSGCLLVAKRRAALRDLHAQLRAGTTEKRYLALLCGKWNLGTKRIELALDTDERRSGERHVAVRAHGKQSVSTFKPVQFFGNLATLVEVEIDTGKTHQIRVHAAHAGHPVAGDDKYGDRVFNDLLRDYGLRRMFLHSSSMGFTRPGTREPMLASAPLPEELGAVLDKLTRGKARAPEDTKGKTLRPAFPPLPARRERSGEARVKADSPLPPRRERLTTGRVREGVSGPPRTGGRRAGRMRKSGKR
ncbi:MAG TPA: RluA family pseudouridine synthase [Steroidobacteraceae bacterium]|nr:RluA family pseudouridine synthase [Steroidobacteraceae bacterium]